MVRFKCCLDPSFTIALVLTTSLSKGSLESLNLDCFFYFDVGCKIESFDEHSPHFLSARTQSYLPHLDSEQQKLVENTLCSS